MDKSTATNLAAPVVERFDEGDRVCQQVILDAASDSVISVRSSRTDPDVEITIPDGDEWLHIRVNRLEAAVIVATLTAALREPTVDQKVA